MKEAPMLIRAIDSAQFEALRPELCALLLDVVTQGASIGFLRSLDHAEANRYWTDVQAAMAGGTRLLFVAEREGRVCGSVQLDLCMKANGVNRAEVQKLVVHSNARRAGVATALMAVLEGEALARRRGLLFLDTEAGAGAEHLYRQLGYTFLGGLPEYACSPDGVWNYNAIYFKTLFKRAAT
jgi:acetyltransferase